MEKIKVDVNVELNQDTLDELRSVVFSSKAVEYLKIKYNLKNDEIEKNIGVLYDFVKDREYCVACPGLEKCTKANSGLCTDIIVKNGKIESKISPCPEYLKKMSLTGKFVIKDFPEEWLDDNPANINQNNTRRAIMSKFITAIKNKTSDWIYIKNVEGSGASYLAAMLSIYAAKKDCYPICFINAKKTFEELASDYYKDKESFFYTFRKILNCKILVIDGFGEENKNNLVRDEIVLPLLCYRKDHNLMTYINSGFSINDLAISYMTSKAGERNAKTIKSILLDKCKSEFTLSEFSIY